MLCARIATTFATTPSEGRTFDPLDQRYRIIYRDLSGLSNIGVNPQVLCRLTHDGPQHRRILAQSLLLQRRHHAPHRRDHARETLAALDLDPIREMRLRFVFDRAPFDAARMASN